MPSRRTFVLGSASALALAGCGGAAAVFRPNVAPGGLGASERLETLSIRKNPIRSVARSQAAFRKRFPAGSTIYDYGMYLIQDGNDFAAFPQTAVFTRAADGLHVYNNFTKVTTSFSTAASVTLFVDAGETILAPNQTPDATLQVLLNARAAQPVGNVRATLPASNRRHTSADAGKAADDGGYYYNGSYGSYSGYQVAANANDISSAHNQCLTGSENIGVSYTVPAGYPSNVMVAICVDNGTKNECFYFRNQAPGSSHNVSMYLPGTGSAFMSMSIVSSTSTTNGVGWAQLDGC